MICPNCNTVVSDGQKFCENCGTPIADNMAATAAMPTEPTQDPFAEPADPFAAATDPFATTPADPFAPPEDPNATAPADPFAAPAADPFAAPAADPYAAPADPYAAPAADPYAAPASPGTTAQMPYGAPAGQYNAPGQYNQPPMQPGQVPYGAPQPQGSNTPFVLAIIALVTAVLGLFPVSIILGIIALVMNNKQKKQGIATTKQTPTFVMSLISLILSALMLIATIALGGLIWAALASGEFNVSNSGGSVSVTTNSSGTSVSVGTTSSSGAASSAASSGAASSAGTSTSSVVPTSGDSQYTGKWQLDSMRSDGEDVTSDDIELMRQMGLDVTLELKADGTASFVLFDEEMTGTWTDNGSKGINMTLAGEAIPLSYDGTLLTMEANGDWLAFRKA